MNHEQLVLTNSQRLMPMVDDLSHQTPDSANSPER